MGYGRHYSASSYPVPEPIVPPPIADYNVEPKPGDTLSPDCSCNYFYEGEHGGYPYYRHTEGLWLISYSVPSERYVISSVFDPIEGARWLKYGPEVLEITGEYFHVGDSQGNAIVSEGPH